MAAPLPIGRPEDARLSTGYGRGGRALLPRREGGRRPDEGLRSRSPARAPGASRPRRARAVAAEGREPDREIDRIAAEPAFGQHDGDFARDSSFALARGVDHHAREARRQRQARDRAALVGDAAVAVERADRRQQRARFLQRGARRRIEEGKRRRIGDAPERADRARGRRDRRRGFPARRKAEGRRSRPPPTSDSRRPARCGRRGRAAGRRWPADARPSRAASGRCRARRPGRA